MQDTFGTSLKKLDWIRRRKNRMLAILILLSLIVMLDVFWVLRQPGLTLAGDATCGITEHTHDETCNTEENPCPLEEHVHSITCYSDDTADVETPLDWQEMFADYPYTGSLSKDLAGIAQTQTGYAESELNFEVDSDGNRHGYTRYGAWYSAPYADWSAMFVSFCLSYAGADENENPVNSGADSMAKAWAALGKYAEAGTYTPAEGDLVFFTDNTAGIVTMVQNATFCAICGDIDDKVSNVSLSLDDPSIAGWGLTEGTVSVEEEVDEPESEISQTELLDISNGPAFFIFAEKKAEQKSQRLLAKSSRTITNLTDYLKDENVKGEYDFAIVDTNNVELEKDDNGNYIAEAGTTYKLTLLINSANGIHPGTYQYQLPDGLEVNGGTGNFVLDDDTEVGTWEVTDQGLITMVFNENMNSRTDVTISATMGVHFLEQEEPLDFDGKIKVTIEEPPQDVTKLTKWGQQGVEGNTQKPDPSKIYWKIVITGNGDSQIPGSIITDQILYGDHNYTDSDIAGGLQFGVSETNPETGAEIAWHSWWVSPDDPNLTWTEDGWTYKIPEVVSCNCGDLKLGNDGWIYYIDYSSTPDTDGIGTLAYANRVITDGQQTEGWANVKHTESIAKIIKQGTFHGDTDGGAFYWEVQATIPGLVPGQKAEYAWYITDILRIRDNTGLIDTAKNNFTNCTITATNNGKTVTVPNYNEVTAEDQFACERHEAENSSTHFIDILARCHCTEENCVNWQNGTCGTPHWSRNGFCHCWAVEGDTTFTFSYETDDLSVIEKYGGTGKEMVNTALLYTRSPDNWNQGIQVTDTYAAVPIPGMFKKELTKDYNGHIASYEITVNESKLALTNGSPLTIHDMMTETLTYIRGSMVITAEDADGNKTTLRRDEDYTITYDGTGDQKDENGNPVHVLDIVILHPQPVMYILDYDATLNIPTGTTEGVRYSNSATIHLWGQDLSDSATEKLFTDINIAAKTYKVDMHKKDSQTGDPLPGATFGLFNERGGRITSDVTDAEGNLRFETNVTDGIILREHVLYYMQEMEAPPGYQLDDKKYWFCFCNNTKASCEECEKVMKDTDAFRIPHETIGKAEAVNVPTNYNLPATGGWGIYPLLMTSGMLIITVLLLGFIQRRKLERRKTS